MSRKRTCSSRCHNAKGTRCKCVCQGFYHGSTGAANREALHQATEEEVKETLEQHGLKESETRYIEQIELPLEVASVK